MRSPLGDQSLAEMFADRFAYDFPKFKGKVRFFEFPSEAAFLAPKSAFEKLIDRVARGFRPPPPETQPHPFEFHDALFDTLSEELPSFEKNQLRAVWESALEQKPTMTPHRPRGETPQNANEQTAKPDVSGAAFAIVGPDRYTPMGHILGLRYDLSLPSAHLRDDVDKQARRYIYDHEAGHALFSLNAIQDPEDSLGRNFEEAVCDSYALFRHAADGGDFRKMGDYFAAKRAYMWEMGGLRHYTTPTVLKTMEEIGTKRLRASPQELFNRAVKVAFENRITFDMVNAGLKPLKGRHQTRQDFCSFFKSPT